MSRAPDGQEHPFKGVYQEIVPAQRIVQTFIYDVEGIREHPALETITLEEHAGRTIFTNGVRHDSPQARDGYLNAGMEAGAAESLDRLAELLASIASHRSSAGARA